MPNESKIARIPTKHGDCGVKSLGKYIYYQRCSCFAWYGVLFIFWSFVLQTPATQGVILAGIACFLGICSRVVQAEVRQTENKKIWIAGTREQTNPDD